MAAYSGPIREIQYNYPTIGSGIIKTKANEDGTLDLGGLRKVDDDEMIAGDGSNITQMKRVKWSLECTAVWDANVNEDLEKINAASAAVEDGTWTIMFENGTVYKATGGPVGDLKGATQTGEFPLKLAGGGKAVKIGG